MEYPIIFAIVILIVLIFVFRELNNWYWKINERITIQKRTNFLLEKIAIQLGATDLDEIAIEETQNQIFFTIEPNPFTSETTITFIEEQKNITIRILDSFGKEIKTFNLTGRQQTIERGEMKTGVYFVQTVDVNKNIITKKLLVQ